MLQIILILLGLATNGSEANTQNMDQGQTETTQIENGEKSDTGGEDVLIPPKK